MDDSLGAPLAAGFPLFTPLDTRPHRVYFTLRDVFFPLRFLLHLHDSVFSSALTLDQPVALFCFDIQCRFNGLGHPPFGALFSGKKSTITIIRSVWDSQIIENTAIGS
jgi:hypothetical protein